MDVSEKNQSYYSIQLSFEKPQEVWIDIYN